MAAGVSFWHVAAVAAGGGVLWWWVASRRLEVGAWTGIAAITNPREAIALARARGVDRLAIFVNQAPEGGPFKTYARDAIVAACALFRSAGLKLTIVTWMTPRADWIAGASVVGQIATEVGADELEFDLEEEWTALRSQSDAVIADVTARVVANARATFRGKLAADFIVYTDQRVLRPFLQAVDVLIPQAYATAHNASNLPAGALERKAHELFAPYGKELVMGVAGWNQQGAYGSRVVREVMRMSLDAVRALGVRRVRVWRLELLDASEGVELAEWKARTRTGGGEA